MPDVLCEDYGHMKWNPNYRYKLLGKQIISGGERLFVFDLTSAVIFPPVCKENTFLTSGQSNAPIPLYPETWKTQFGLPVEEHRKVFQINLFDKFAVFSVKDASKKETDSSKDDFAAETQGED